MMFQVEQLHAPSHSFCHSVATKWHAASYSPVAYWLAGISFHVPPTPSSSTTS